MDLHRLIFALLGLLFKYAGYALPILLVVVFVCGVYGKLKKAEKNE